MQKLQNGCVKTNQKANSKRPIANSFPIDTPIYARDKPLNVTVGLNYEQTMNLSSFIKITHYRLTTNY